MLEDRIRQLESLLARAASCITDAEEAHGAFDTDKWTRDEIQKRWEFWRDYWTYGDPVPRDEWPDEYAGERWDACEECDYNGFLHEQRGTLDAPLFVIERCDTCGVYATDEEAKAAHDTARPACHWELRNAKPEVQVCEEARDV